MIDLIQLQDECDLRASVSIYKIGLLEHFIDISHTNRRRKFSVETKCLAPCDMVTNTFVWRVTHRLQEGDLQKYQSAPLQNECAIELD